MTAKLLTSSQIFKKTYLAIKKEPWILFYTLVVGACASVVEYLSIALANDIFNKHLMANILYWLIFVGLNILGFYFTLKIVGLFAKTQKQKIHQANFWKRYIGYVILFFIYSFFIIGGLFYLIVLGAIYWVWFSFVLYFFYYKNIGGIKAIILSKKLFTNRFNQVFKLWFPPVLIIILFSLILGYFNFYLAINSQEVLLPTSILLIVLFGLIFNIIYYSFVFGYYSVLFFNLCDTAKIDLEAKIKSEEKARQLFLPALSWAVVLVFIATVAILNIIY